MPISSVSKIYDAPDPIMETDLELLAKVNVFQQSKFDEGEQALQNEIDNWALLADVAKPQDREYINSKLNNLVSGINNLGGVNLADKNNVNQLRALGYNLYGDNTVINAVATTKKMRGFMADAKTKLSGKDAKDYDSVYYEYNLDKWNDWLNDGQTGSSFNGPTELGQGNFGQYQKKIQEAVSKLTPDLDEAPQGSDAINYLQVGNKYIKKERIKTLIDGMTTAQDADLINAHAWKGFSGVVDDRLLGLTMDNYSSKQKELQGQYNAIKHQMALSQDFNQRELYKKQLDQIDKAVKDIGKQKVDLFNETNGKSLTKEQRQGLRSNLYFDAFKDDISTALAFEQNKTELKMNAGRAFQLKEARDAYEFGEMMKFRSAEFDLAIRKQDFEETKSLLELGLAAGDAATLQRLGIQGPAANAPLTLVENLGKDEATVFNGETVKNANLNYIGASNQFYQNAYNTVGSLPEYQKYVTRNADGLYVPKDDASKKILDQAVLAKVGNFEQIAKMPLNERSNVEKNLSAQDVQLLNSYQGLQEAQLYSKQVEDLEDQAFRTSGYESPGTKKVYAYTYNRDNNKYSLAGQFTIRELKKMKDTNDPRLKTLLDNYGFFTQKDNPSDVGKSFLEPQEQLDKFIGDYYDKAEKGWNAVSKNFSALGKNVTLPKGKEGKVNQPLAQYFGDKVRRQAEAAGDKGVAATVTESDVDINRVWVKYDANNKGSKVRYMAEVKYQKGNAKGGDKLYKVDLTDDVLSDPGSFVGRLYPRDNTQVIYGFMMDKDGSTPFTADDGYASALKTTSNPKLTFNYRIVANKNPNNGIQSFNIDILIPKRDKETGKVNYITQRVKNSYGGFSTTFPANFQAAVDYMNEYFKNDQTAAQFYQMHNIPTE